MSIILIFIIDQYRYCCYHLPNKGVATKMDFVKMSDSAIMSEIGQRVAQERLNRNMEQAVLARQAGIARRTLQRMESGEVSTLGSLIRVLRVLDKLDGLDNFLSPPGISPLQLAKLKGLERKRAAGRRGKDKG